MLLIKTRLSQFVRGLGVCLVFSSASLSAQEWTMESVAEALNKLEQQAPKKEQQQINALLEQFKAIEQQTTPEQRAQINKMLKAVQNIDASSLNLPKVSGSLEVQAK